MHFSSTHLHSSPSLLLLPSEKVMVGWWRVKRKPANPGSPGSKKLKLKTFPTHKGPEGGAYLRFCNFRIFKNNIEDRPYP